MNEWCSFIDKIIYINLDRRTDRLQHIQQEFKRLNIPDEKIIRFAGINHEYPNSGCNLSHAAALKYAYDNNLNNVLILEDDFKFIDDLNLINTSIKYFFNKIKEWDVLLFTDSNIQSKDYDSVLNKCIKSTNASAYLVNRNIMLYLSQLIEDAAIPLANTHAHWLYQNDVVWQSFMQTGKWYSFKIRLGNQMDGYSDLSNAYKIHN